MPTDKLNLTDYIDLNDHPGKSMMTLSSWIDNIDGEIADIVEKEDALKEKFFFALEQSRKAIEKKYGKKQQFVDLLLEFNKIQSNKE